MTEQNQIITFIAEKISDNLDKPTCPKWLIKEVDSLLIEDTVLTNHLYQAPVEIINKVADHHFDSIRRWNGAKAAKFATHIASADKRTKEQLTLKDYIKAGLLVHLAVIALEEVKYYNKNGIVKNICPLQALFEINEFIRGNNRKPVNKSSSSDGASNDSENGLRLRPKH